MPGCPRPQSNQPSFLNLSLIHHDWERHPDIQYHEGRKQRGLSLNEGYTLTAGCI